MNLLRSSRRRSMGCRRTQSRKWGERRGGVLIVAMVSLLIMTAISATLLRMAIMQTRQAKQLELRHQAECLAIAGLDRAAIRLASETDYTGETWTVSADQLGKEGSVVIRVTGVDGDGPSDGMTDRRTVTAQARFPVGDERRVQVTLSRQVSVPPAASDNAAPDNATPDNAAAEEELP